MAALLKILFVVGPIAAAGLLQAQSALGVTHQTVAGSIATWILALTLSGRSLATQNAKNVTEVPGGGA